MHSYQWFSPSQVGPQSSHVHDFTVTFFLTGVFKLELSCRSLDLEGLGSLSAVAAAALAVKASPSSPKRGHTLGTNIAANLGANLGDKGLEEASHIWRCSPPIEVTIVAPST